MENKKSRVLKIFTCFLFAVAVFAMFFYVIFVGDVTHNALSFACVATCFVLSLLFLKVKNSKALITFALAVNVVADYFFVLMPEHATVANLVLYILCGLQFVYFLYTLTFCKGIGLKILNIALRVGLCLIAYFLAERYWTLTVPQIIEMMCFINSFVTLLALLVNIKKDWLLFLGFLLFFASQFFGMLTLGGWAEILGTSGRFFEFITSNDLSYYLYIPGLLLISLSSVLFKNEKKG